jgi:glycine hydroxymethyltransferase
LIGRLFADVLDGLAANGDAGNAKVEARVKGEALALVRRFPMYT